MRGGSRLVKRRSFEHLEGNVEMQRWELRDEGLTRKDQDYTSRLMTSSV